MTTMEPKEKVCTICGNTHYDSFSFKSGKVCEECLKVVKKLPINKSSKSDKA